MQTFARRSSRYECSSLRTIFAVYRRIQIESNSIREDARKLLASEPISTEADFSLQQAAVAYDLRAAYAHR